MHVQAAPAQRTTERTVLLAGIDLVTLPLGDGKLFGVNKITERLIQRDSIVSGNGFIARGPEDTLVYTVIVEGPRLTSRGAYHATTRDSRTYSDVPYDHQIDDIPEHLSQFLMGPYILRTMIVGQPDFPEA